MAGSKSSVTGEDFYGAYDAQDTAANHAEELHMQTVPSLNITYTEVHCALCFAWLFSICPLCFLFLLPIFACFCPCWL